MYLLMFSLSSYFIFSSVGKHHKVYDWIKDKPNFDVGIVAYDEDTYNNLLERKSDFKFVEYNKAMKFPNLYHCYKKYGDLFHKYDYVGIWDDDATIDTKNINNLFEVAKNIKPTLFSASHTGKVSFQSHQHSIDKPDLLRVSFIEMGYPILSKELFKLFITNYDGTFIRWGLDFYLAYLALTINTKLIICNSISIYNPFDEEKGGREETKYLPMVYKVNPYIGFDTLCKKYNAEILLHKLLLRKLCLYVEPYVSNNFNIKNNIKNEAKKIILDVDLFKTTSETTQLFFANKLTQFSTTEPYIIFGSQQMIDIIKYIRKGYPTYYYYINDISEKKMLKIANKINPYKSINFIIHR